MQRHGARFPTSSFTPNIEAAEQKLQSARIFVDAKLDFLKNYTYSLPQDDLIPFGVEQSQNAGKEVYNRYKFLLSQDDLPFVRASSAARVVNSANNWTAGFSSASHHVFNPVLSVVLDKALSDTLVNGMCPNAGSSDAQTDNRTSIYASPIATRLNALTPGAGLDAVDISNLLPLCALETLAEEAPNRFCDLFTLDEFAHFLIALTDMANL